MNMPPHIIIKHTENMYHNVIEWKSNKVATTHSSSQGEIAKICVPYPMTTLIFTARLLTHNWLTVRAVCAVIDNSTKPATPQWVLSLINILFNCIGCRKMILFFREHGAFLCWCHAVSFRCCLCYSTEKLLIYHLDMWVCNRLENNFIDCILK